MFDYDHNDFSLEEWLRHNEANGSLDDFDFSEEEDEDYDNDPCSTDYEIP